MVLITGGTSAALGHKDCDSTGAAGHLPHLLGPGARETHLVVGVQWAQEVGVLLDRLQVSSQLEIFRKKIKIN